MSTTGDGVSNVVTNESSELDETNLNPPPVDGGEGEGEGEKLSARDLKLLEMRQRIREEREADNGTEASQEPPPAAPPASTAPKAEGFEIFEKDGKQFVKLKAYGQTEELPLEVALRRAQKDVASDRKLQEAVERERRAAAQEEMAQAHLQRVQAATTLRPVTQVEPTEQPDLTEAFTKLYNGDIEDAAKQLSKIIAGRQQATPSINPEMIAAEVEQRLQRNAAAARQAQYDAELLNAVTVFNDEYPEIAKDNRLSAYFDRETELVMAENPGMSMLDVVRTAAGSIQKLSAPPAQSQTNTRLEAKRNAPRHNSNGVRSPSVSTHIEPPPKPITPGDTIARMKQLRGQATR